MSSDAFIHDHMLIDPVLQKEVIRRAIDGNLGDHPAQAVHSLGSLETPDGKTVAVFLRHAADAILMDEFDHVVLIVRTHNPGAGLKALPGGFMDPVPETGGTMVAEQAVAAALREATEETGISTKLLAEARTSPVGHRSYDRAFDIRVAWADIPDTAIKQGDFFAVSTQAFRVQTQRDLSHIFLNAGDDAKEVLVAEISGLTADEFGVPDHLAMIRAAQTMDRTS